MAIKLRELIYRLDATEYGESYSSLLFVFWANAPELDPEEPDPGPKPWETWAYRQVGEALLRVEVPATLTDDGQPLTVPVGSGRALYQLEHSRTFERAVLVWAMRCYLAEHVAWCGELLKNSGSASGKPAGS